MPRRLLTAGLFLLIGCTVQPPAPLTQTPPPQDSGSLGSARDRSGVSDRGAMDRPTSHVSSPKSSVLTIPFTSQAPNALWDDLHNEACEEASLIMVRHFLEGTTLTREQAEQEIQDLVAWQTKHGIDYDVSAVDLKIIAEQYYGYTAHIEENPTAERIRELVHAGHPVIVPVAGRLLQNPYFRGEGPWYHMLVVRGYRERLIGTLMFITNDPGTRRGEGYEYREEILMNAIHDWIGVKERTAEGPKRILILEKRS